MKTRTFMGCCSAFIWLSLVIWSDVGSRYYKEGLSVDSVGSDCFNEGTALHYSSETIEEPETYAEAVQRKTGFGWNGQMLVLALMAGGFQYLAMNPRANQQP